MRTAMFIILVIVFAALAGAAPAEEIVVQMNLLNEDGVGPSVGTVTLTDAPQGMKLSPSLSDLPPGVHGFHVHEKPDCGPAMKDGKSTPGLAAGGHFDPEITGKHEGPLGNGHLGDLPSLMVGLDGKALEAVIAPRLKTGDVKDHSLMIHAGGDNYSDTPEKLGGGGARVACGVIK